MALSRIQRTDGHGTLLNALATSAFSNSNTVGNAIVVFVNTLAGNNTDVTSITDKAGNTYTRITGIFRIQDSTGIEMWIAQNIASYSGNVVTAHDNGSFLNNIIAIEIAGLPLYGSIEDDARQQPGPDYAITRGDLNFVNGPLNNRNANDIIFLAACISNNTGVWTMGPGFTYLDNPVTSHNSFAVESRIVSAAGAYSAIFNQSTTNQYISGLLVSLSDTPFGTVVSPSSSLSASISPSSSASPSRSPSSSSSPSASASPSLSPSASLSPSSSASLSPSSSVSPSASQSLSPSSSRSPSASASPSASVSPSISPSASISRSPSQSAGPPGIVATINEPPVFASVDTDSSPVSIES